MKILFTDIHQHNGGGHVTYILGLIDALRHEHDITLAAPPSSRLFRYAGELANVRVEHGRYTSRIFTLASEVARLHHYLAREQFDIVHVNASADHRHIMLARLGLARPPKVIWTKHNLHPLSSVGHKLRARFGTDSVIAVSDFVHQALLESPYKKLPISTIHHGIALEHFQPASNDEKRRQRERFFGTISDDVIVLGSTGGTDSDKGWQDLVSALALLNVNEQQRFRVIVAGDPPNADRRRALALTQLDDYVLFPGLLDDVRTVFAASDAGFVLSHHEALSYACRESLACGLPTLISNAGGLPENLEQGVEGWIVPVGKPEDIAHVLRGMLLNPESLAAMGRAARERSMRLFAMPRFVESTVAIYKKVLTPPAQAGSI